MTINLTEYAKKLASNPQVLLKVEPSNQNVEKWLKSRNEAFPANVDREKPHFIYAINYINKINSAVTKKSYLRLEKRINNLLCCSIGDKCSHKNTNRKSLIAFDNGRVYIRVKKAKEDLVINFIIHTDYIRDFDEIMEVGDIAKPSLYWGKSYKSRFKKDRHDKKPNLRSRDVYFELNDSLFEQLEYYFSTFKLTEYYKKCPMLIEWMPAVFSGRLFRQGSDSLDELQPSTEDEYQNLVQDSDAEILGKGPIKKPKKVKRGNSLAWDRKPGIAKSAIEKANYKCLVSDGHASFTSKKTGKQYVEAHHIYPMSSQGKFNHSLDVPENIAVLCPNCHKQIHLAEPLEKKKIIKYLFDLKKDELNERAIDWTYEELCGLY
jgi:5-methylcytosine-specific restriction endonuclease McrA